MSFIEDFIVSPSKTESYYSKHSNQENSQSELIELFQKILTEQTSEGETPIDENTFFLHNRIDPDSLRVEDQVALKELGDMNMEEYRRLLESVSSGALLWDEKELSDISSMLKTQIRKFPILKDQEARTFWENAENLERFVKEHMPLFRHCIARLLLLEATSKAMQTGSETSQLEVQGIFSKKGGKVKKILFRGLNQELYCSYRIFEEIIRDHTQHCNSNKALLFYSAIIFLYELSTTPLSFKNFSLGKHFKSLKKKKKQIFKNVQENAKKALELFILSFFSNPLSNNEVYWFVFHGDFLKSRGLCYFLRGMTTERFHEQFLEKVNEIISNPQAVNLEVIVSLFKNSLEFFEKEFSELLLEKLFAFEEKECLENYDDYYSLFVKRWGEPLNSNLKPKIVQQTEVQKFQHKQKENKSPSVSTQEHSGQEEISSCQESEDEQNYSQSTKSPQSAEIENMKFLLQEAQEKQRLIKSYWQQFRKKYNPRSQHLRSHFIKSPENPQLDPKNLKSASYHFVKTTIPMTKVEFKLELVDLFREVDRIKGSVEPHKPIFVSVKSIKQLNRLGLKYFIRSKKLYEGRYQGMSAWIKVDQNQRVHFYSVFPQIKEEKELYGEEISQSYYSQQNEELKSEWIDVV